MGWVRWSWLVAAAFLVSGLAAAGESPGDARVREIVREELKKGVERPSPARGGERLFDRVEFSLGVTSVVQGSVGAEEEISDEEDVNAASASVDMEFSAKLAENWKGYVHLEAGSGAGVDGYLNLLVGVNDDADDDESLRLTEAWVEGSWKLAAQHSLSVRFGKLDLTAEFDTNEAANDEIAQFLGCGFVSNPTFAAPENDFGAILAYAYEETVTLKLGCADCDEIDDRGGKFSDDLFMVGELGLSVELFGRKGNYRAFVWYDDAKRDRIDGSKTDSPGAGWGLSLDQGIIEGLTAFFRLGMADEEYYEIEAWVSSGVEIGGALWGREDDAVGLAYGAALLGDDAKDVLEAADKDPQDEHHLELYYRFKMNEHMELSPSVQVITNPGGGRRRGDHCGLRSEAAGVFLRQSYRVSLRQA